MKVKVKEIGQGLHPSEVVVAIATNDGEQNLVIDRRSLQNNFINIGYPIIQREHDYLIELPRETSTGSWRVWVNKDEVEGQDESERQVA
jgi:hypothetical protein